MLIAAVAASAAVIATAALAMSGTPPKETSHVPNVVGLSALEASERLTAAGLRWKFDGDAAVHDAPLRQSESVVIEPSPADDPVREQEPAAGSAVEAGAVVELTTRCTESAMAGRGCL